MRTKLEAVQQRSLAALARCGNDEEEEGDANEKIGKDMLAEMGQILTECTEWSQHRFCYVHQQMCPSIPPDHNCHGGTSRFLIEVAGTTCVAWSSMRGKQSFGSRWGHASTLSFLVWLHWVRRMKPCAIIHECVPAFDWGTLAEVLSQLEPWEV